ncbi:hypothetical protein WJX79_000837 [Trebouxia sp. C0005]
MDGLLSGDTQCEQDELADLVDFEASDEEVLSRIEHCVSAFLDELSFGRLQSIQTVSRESSNAYLESGTEQIRLQQAVQTRSLTFRQGESAFHFVRIFKVLEVVHELLRTGKQATQRDLYYRLLHPPIFSTTRDVHEAIQDTVSLLRVPRSCLNICCSSRGAVSGLLHVQEHQNEPWIDCCASGCKTLPGDCNAIFNYCFQTTAQYILVVEKDAIFQRLVEDGFCNLAPSIMLTAKGMPDLSTRVFLRQLHEAFPQLPVLGLVDWNPSGVAILGVYKWGSVRMGLESPRYAVPSLMWLGACHDMLEGADEEVWQPLTARDRAMIGNLRAGVLQHNAAWTQEVDLMEEWGSKAELEALYNVHGFAGFSEMLAQHVLQQKYLQ